jgi:soluble lytic murein transglycosylase
VWLQLFFRALAAVCGSGILLLWLTVSPLKADIYMYRDGSGVLHFSNVPTSGNYRLYMRSPRARRPIYSTTRYDAIITQAARQQRLSFSLLKAIIKAESDFNPRAVSAKGAMGLMQIMPDNLKRLGIRDPFDPRQNIMGGARYLRQLYNRFDQRLPLALAAYNAGPEAVERYQRIPPFRETESYVRKVMRFYEFFSRG